MKAQYSQIYNLPLHTAPPLSHTYTHTQAETGSKLFELLTPT